MILRKTWPTSSTLHLNTIMSAELVAYSIRDLVPLSTYTQIPMDIEQGNFLWAKIGVIFVNAAVIPLCIPRRYTPLDPLVSHVLQIISTSELSTETQDPQSRANCINYIAAVFSLPRLSDL